MRVFLLFPLILLRAIPAVNGRFIRDFFNNAIGRSGDFEITLDFKDVPFLHRLRYFFPARLQWQNTIVGDVRDVNDDRLPNFDPTDCGPYPASVDDLYICASYKRIDGAGGVVGGGYASIYRLPSYLPIVGSMVFDEADVPSLRRDSKFRASILSEMGTVLGLNLFAWEGKGLVTSATANPPCVYKADSNATREWRSISGCTNSVPVESSFPADLAIQCGHWDEECMQKEIMTPRVQRRGPVSRVTIGALEDLGYTVDYSKADSFGASDVAASCRCSDSSSRALIRKVSEQSGRQLSSSGFDAAVSYGKELISKYQSNMRQESEIADMGYIVGNAAIVLVYEDGELFSVTTTL